MKRGQGGHTSIQRDFQLMLAVTKGLVGPEDVPEETLDHVLTVNLTHHHSQDVCSCLVKEIIEVRRGGEGERRGGIKEGYSRSFVGACMQE